MRPAVPDQLPSHPRKPSTSNRIGSIQCTESYSEPDSFFLTRNDEMGSSDSSTSSGVRDSMYGVQSLEETMKLSADESHCTASDNHSHGLQDDERPAPPLLHRMSTVKPAPGGDMRSSRPSSLAFGHNQAPEIAPSLPVTPLLLASPPMLGSLSGSPKSTSTRSIRRSDEISIPDEASNHAMESDNEENIGHSATLEGSAPQLVMPSIRMPSRRPFTERGKSLGRLKVMIAGAAGSGKTSLLRSIVQACEDIVHVDPLPQNTFNTRSGSLKKGNLHQESKLRRPRDRPSIVEVYASTKPYPTWWSDLEDSRVLRRKKSLGDVVLERNLCFVDSVNSSLDRTEQTGLEISYMVQQFQRVATAINSTNADLQGLLSGNGGSQVDAILYLISEGKYLNVPQMQNNVIPLIAKADTLSPAQIRDLKSLFLQKTPDSVIRNSFGTSPLDIDNTATPYTPFSISSVTTNDDEIMDASILMSPDYVQPLAPSELGFLLEKMFDQDNFIWFRHSAAKKLIQAHNLHKATPEQRVATPISATSDFDISEFTSPFSWISQSQAPNSPHHVTDLSKYALARVADHTRREENLAQIQLAKWATDLQRSLQNERRQYESLARNERAAWLTQRLDECVADGTLVPVREGSVYQKTSSILTVRSHDGRRVRYCIANMSPNDPLGLIRLNDDMRRRGWIVFQVIGSVGVVGGLAIWLAKSLGLTSKDFLDWIRSC
ncbi:hypothetical protein PRK78_004279 [Emydomyces testavorans]|uniref:DUF6780 domain-containing protein n=1 Tax=Emydomyces testavorans TaxID=2070801 RepID=A0AAF0IJM0_9EURO|nr:hypothetical protein PRK78_004279 [Emydomyces testavorans]